MKLSYRFVSMEGTLPLIEDTLNNSKRDSGMDWYAGQILDFGVSSFEGVSLGRAILAFILVFFLPGFAWTLIFFKSINTLERIALSFGLSIALVTLSILALNVLFNVRITVTNSLLTIVVLTIIPMIIYSIQRYAKKRLSNKADP